MCARWNLWRHRVLLEARPKSGLHETMPGWRPTLDLERPSRRPGRPTQCPKRASKQGWRPTRARRAGFSARPLAICPGAEVRAHVLGRSPHAIPISRQTAHQQLTRQSGPIGCLRKPSHQYRTHGSLYTISEPGCSRGHYRDCGGLPECANRTSRIHTICTGSPSVLHTLPLECTQYDRTVERAKT